MANQLHRPLQRRLPTTNDPAGSATSHGLVKIHDGTFWNSFFFFHVTPDACQESFKSILTGATLFIHAGCLCLLACPSLLLTDAGDMSHDFFPPSVVLMILKYFRVLCIGYIECWLYFSFVPMPRDSNSLCLSLSSYSPNIFCIISVFLLNVPFRILYFLIFLQRISFRPDVLMILVVVKRKSGQIPSCLVAKFTYSIIRGSFVTL